MSSFPLKENTHHLQVDPELKDILPGYLSSCREKLGWIKNSLLQKDFTTMETIGHRLRGSGALYGLPAITEYGRRIETAAQKKDQLTIGQTVAELDGFLAGLRLD